MRKIRVVRGETFQEWKAKKDLEARQSKMESLNQQKERARKNEFLAKERQKKEEAVKTWLRKKHDSPLISKSSPDTVKKIESTKTFFSEETKTKSVQKDDLKLKEMTKEEKQREDDKIEFYSTKRDSSLTFSEWLEKKERDRLAKIREREARKQEKEAEEREKQEMSKRAVQEWMVKTKYRALTRHFPKLREQEINNRIWQDLKL